MASVSRNSWNVGTCRLREIPVNANHQFILSNFSLSIIALILRLLYLHRDTSSRSAGNTERGLMCSIILYANLHRMCKALFCTPLNAQAQEIHVVDVNRITIYLLHVLTQWQEYSNRFYYWCGGYI